ncbi:MAG: amino acid racemase [Phycisphaerales bacterium]|nr:amino acid racemase [Phycisphaerales bacterium]
MTKQIGIVGVSPEGASLCYQQLFRHAAVMLEPHMHPTVCVHNIPLAQYVDAVRRDDWRQVANLLRDSAQRLAAIGAEFCFTPDNAVQHAVQLAEASSTIPWLKMTNAVAERIATDNRKTIGVIGTKYVTSGSAYQTDLGVKGIKLVRPSSEDSEMLDRIIFDELVFGIVREESRIEILDTINRLKDKGCEGVILGCSEAPLIVTEETCDLPIYNASDIMAEQAIRYAITDNE